MKIYNTMDKQVKPPVVMLVFGNGGVGKTTFASTAPKPILADCEGGAKYFGLRGIGVDVAPVAQWNDMKELLEHVKGTQYETVIIDPIGELMEKLMKFMVGMNDGKLVQRDGTPTMAGWGWLKKVLRDYFKVLRDSGKHIIFVAHVDEKDSDGQMIKRPMIATKLSQELINMVDVVGYMTVVGTGDDAKRVILVDPESDRYVAKDRTGQLGKVIEPDFVKIIQACQGTKTYSWSKPGKVAPVEKTKDVVEPTEEEKQDIAEVEGWTPVDAPAPKIKLADSANLKLAKLKK